MFLLNGKAQVLADRGKFFHRIPAKLADPVPDLVDVGANIFERLAHAESEPLKRRDFQGWEVAAIFLAGRASAYQESKIEADVVRRFVAERGTCEFVKAARTYSLLTGLPKLEEEGILEVSPDFAEFQKRVKVAAEARGLVKQACLFEHLFEEEFGDMSLVEFVDHFHDAQVGVTGALRHTRVAKTLRDRGIDLEWVRETYPVRGGKGSAGIKNPHHPSSVGKRLLSVDIVEANLTALGVTLDQALNPGAPPAPFLNWSEFVLIQTGSKFLAQSKMFRQITCGKAFKPWQRCVDHIQTWITHQVIACVGLPVQSVSNDEVTFLFDESREMEPIVSTLRTFFGASFITRLRLTPFVLRSLYFAPKTTIYVRCVEGEEEEEPVFYGVPPGKHVEVRAMYDGGVE